MSTVKINSYVDAVTSTEEEALTKAMALVNGYDSVNNSIDVNGVITKLYYITPLLGRILVVVNDQDRDDLGVDSNILANVNIADYPLVRLPSTIVEYKELIVKLGSSLTDTQILDAAQAIADNTALTALPYKIPVVKIINYNTDVVGELVTSSIFGNNVFLSTDTVVVNDGDSEAGQDVLDGNIGIDLSIETKIMASDGEANDRFGWSVAVSDSRIVIGARYDDTISDNTGSAYIFDLDGNQLHKIVASDAGSNEFFGAGVALSDTHIVIGAPCEHTNNVKAGAAYIFDTDGNELHKIMASDGAEDNYFGYSVAVSNNRIVVGAFKEDTNGDDAGAAYIFDLDGNQLHKITASDAKAGDKFGYSVAVSDSRIVVGSYLEDISGNDAAGAAYIFDLDGNQLAKIQASDIESNSNFGNSVAVSDSRIVVGDYGEDASGSDVGSAYIFDIDGNLITKIQASDVENYANFGNSVAISDSRIVVGAYAEDVDGNNKGRVYVFDLDGNQLDTLQASDGSDNDYFGYSVAVSNSKLVVSSPYEDTNGGGAGAAYIYG